MSNIRKLRPDPIKMDIGDKERVIKYDLNAFAELEKRFGSVEKAMKELQDGGMQSIRMILWAGLIHEEANIDPNTGEPTSYNITPFQVGSWIDPRMLQEVSQSMGEALSHAMPESAVKEAEAMLAQLTNNDGTQGALIVLTPEEQIEEEEKKD